MPTLGHYLMQQKKEVLKRRRQAEGKRRNLRRRAAAEKRHNAAYFVVDVWGGNDYNGGVIHVYMNADEQASFQLLTKQHVFNFKDSHFLAITLQDQIDLETRGFKGLIVRDGDSGRLLHRQRFDPVGGEGDEGEFFRLFARSACHQAEEYYDPAKRASNRIGHNRCMGVKPNRIDAGHSHYARRQRDREEEPPAGGWAVLQGSPRLQRPPEAQTPGGLHCGLGHGRRGARARVGVKLKKNRYRRLQRSGDS